MRSIARILFALAALVLGGAALAVSNHSATAPFPDKVTVPETLRMAPGTMKVRGVRLGMPDEAKILAVKSANSESWNKVLQIGIGRDVPPVPEARSDTLAWEPVPGGMAAHWEVTSTGARALRIGLTAARLPAGLEVRFAGEGGTGTVYGPFVEADLAAMGETFWSPVLEGESAIVELFVPDGASPFGPALAISQVSHLFASPTDSNIDSLAKASQSCEVDLICRSTADAALANVGKSVARMTFTVSGGGTALCTGTLLNPRNGAFTPYFYSANHCISTQTVASTLTTHWFYDRTSCGFGAQGPSYVQLTGGAALLYADTSSDVLLLRLNSTPPAGAVYAGWDEAAVSTGIAITAVHHPAGDFKKVSLGTIGGFSAYDGGAGAANHIIALWNSTATGVTEQGSSGSGIFTAVGQPATDYRLRGGLHGGPSSCSSTGVNLRDYYSRFDQAYPFLAQYLNPPCTYTLSAASQTVGSGATTGTVGVTTTSACAWTATSNATWLTTSSSGTGSGSVGFTIVANTGATARTGTLSIAGQTFTVTQAAAPLVALTVARSGIGSGTVTSLPAGINCGTTCSASFTSGTQVVLTAVPTGGGVFAGWSGSCTGTGTCTVKMDVARNATATFSPGVTVLTFNPASRDLGAQSMNTTAPSQAMTITNGSGGSVTISSITATTHFAVTHNCGVLAALASCAANVFFTPAAVGALIGALTVSSNAGSQSVSLAGTGEKSLVTHYYRAILRRAPDAGGKTFWEAEATRVQALGANVNEVWYAMAGSFFFSSEYLSLNRDNAGFVTDLYTTFFNRVPDTAGFDAWTGQLATGMPREVILASFMFSAEFASFTQAIFGTTTTRREIDTVGDFYRGLLARLPDNSGFNFWVQQFRTAQCSGAAAVTTQAESISSQFALGSEYAARARTNAQYVGDLYNAFLRRGGDIAGVQYWISQLATGARTRENVRQAFIASAEFQARVAGIIAQGCL